MKYLKKYQIFESAGDMDYYKVQSYLKDIFLELEDADYYINIKPLIEYKVNQHDEVIGYHISIKNRVIDKNTHRRLNISLPEILEPLEHAISYLSDQGLSYQIDAYSYDNEDGQSFVLHDVDIESLKPRHIQVKSAGQGRAKYDLSRCKEIIISFR